MNAAYVWSLVCCSFDVSTALITCLSPTNEKEPVFDMAPVFTTSCLVAIYMRLKYLSGCLVPKNVQEIAVCISAHNVK